MTLLLARTEHDNHESIYDTADVIYTDRNNHQTIDHTITKSFMMMNKRYLHKIQHLSSSVKDGISMWLEQPTIIKTSRSFGLSSWPMMWDAIHTILF